MPAFIKAPPIEELGLKELTEILVKHFGHHEGIYDASFKFNLTVGAVRPEPEIESLPGAIVAIAGVGLSQAAEMSPHSVDAAICNPRPKPKPAAKRKA